MTFGKYTIFYMAKPGAYFIQVNDRCPERQGEGFEVSEKQLEALLDKLYQEEF